MRFAVDASTPIAEALRVKGRRLLAHPLLDLIMAVEAAEETQHELRKRVASMVAYGHLDERQGAELLDDVATSLTSHMTIAPLDLYRDRLVEAARRIRRDPRDVPTVALALSLNCGIWTIDQDFFGCGVPVWTTDTLVGHLPFVTISKRAVVTDRDANGDLE